ncbi:MAG: putative serine protease HhoA precursor [Planctomycetota bacterium]
MRSKLIKNPLSNLLRIGAVGILVGAAFVAWSMLSPRVESARVKSTRAVEKRAFAKRSRENGTAAQNNAAQRSGPDGFEITGTERQTLSGREATQPSDHASPRTLDALSAAMERIEKSVVRIEASRDDQANQIGSGFVIDARGLVVTSLHVLTDSTQASVRFRDGATYEIDGYAAVDPDSDLAIVSLKSPPADLSPLPLGDSRDPATFSHVVAIGHPHGLDFSPYDGRISRILNTSELPARSRRFVLEGFRSDSNQRWIQHTAALSEGNSGGPLLDDQGQVIGVNTWVDKEARFGYAIHIRHLRDLQNAIQQTTVPLADRAKKDRIAAIQPADFDELYTRANAFRFRPLSADDYEVLQQLAWAVTVVQMPRSFGDARGEKEMRDLVQAADRVVKRLEKEKWDDLGQLTIVNDHALPRLSEPRSGVFFFATVERIVEGPDGTRGALMQLAGDQQMLFMPLDGQLGSPAAGTQCLVLGVNYDGRVVRYGDNPLQLITALVIATRTILPLSH